MKILNLLALTLFFNVTYNYAQNKVTTISSEDKNHFITATVEFPIVGTYVLKNKKEPIVLLNADGTGIFQLDDLSKKNITWGIECNEEGTPIFKEGFDSAAYSLWYKSKDAKIDSESGDEDWISIQFSIHFNKKEMYIMGERVKVYVD